MGRVWGNEKYFNLGIRVNFLPACALFANSKDLDQAQHDIVPDLDPNFETV